jgi:hypothetical protein
MILEVMQGKKEEETSKRRSSSLSNKKAQSTEIQFDSNNLFAYDSKYTIMFEKKKEESDDDFFITFESLRVKEGDKPSPKKNSIQVDENFSIREELSINKDIMNLLNSPQQQVYLDIY